MKKSKIVCILIILLGCFIFCMFSLSKNKEESLVISEDIEKYLEYLCLDECKIVKYEKSSNKYIVPTINIEKSQIDEYVNNILETYAEYEVVESRKIVQIGDFINVDYSVYLGSKLIDSKTDVLLKVGSGFFDAEFERIVVGNTVNNKYSIKTNKLHNIISENYYDRELIIEWVVKELLVCHEQSLTDEFVKQQMGYESVVAYKESVKKQLENEERKLNIKEQIRNIINKEISVSKFVMDEEQVLEYAVEYVKTYKELANINNMTLEMYIKEVLNISEDNFYDLCYEEAEKEIQRILIIGRIAFEQELKVTSNDIEKYCEIINMSYTNMSSDEKISVRYNILEDKVYELFEGV